MQEVLETRCQRNPRYSLRAFARDLGISAPRLSRVLNGLHGLSVAAAQEIASRLGLSKAEQALFCALVESEHARAPVRREAARKRASELETDFESVGVDSFRAISDWYHLAILELTLVEGFEDSATWIARELGITTIEARGAIDRLIRLELLERNAGKLRATGSHFVNPDGVPSDAVRKFHSQVIARALQSVDLQTAAERELSSLTLAIDESDLPQARGLIREFTRRFGALVGKGTRKTRVYNLSVQFFGLQNGLKRQIPRMNPENV